MIRRSADTVQSRGVPWSQAGGSPGIRVARGHVPGRDRHGDANPQRPDLSDREVNGPCVGHPDRRRRTVHSLPGERADYLPSAHHAGGRRHDDTPGDVGFCPRGRTLRRFRRPDVYVLQRQPRHRLQRRPNRIHHASNPRADPACIGMHGRGWSLQRPGSKLPDPELHGSGRSQIRYRLIFSQSHLYH